MDGLNTEGWQKVEFTCMIQDILGNELYSKENADKLSDRTIFYCISVPGENEWVRKNRNESSSPDVQIPEKERSSLSNSPADDDKNLLLSMSLVNRSYPIHGKGKNSSYLIKVYDLSQVELLRVNDLVRVVGLLEPNEFEDDAMLETSKSPDRLDAREEDNHNNSNKTSDSNGKKIQNESDFEPAADFPHHLVPRVHVQNLLKLDHLNPLVPIGIKNLEVDGTFIKMARARISNILTAVLAGDSLASEYLILSLISHIHSRQDVTILGQFTLGLCGFKPSMAPVIKKLYEIITKITTHSHYIPLTIASLNSLSFTPTKDFENNKMLAGSLQLPDGMYLMLDETVLTEGQLNNQGVENVNTLNHIIRWQRHNYNFKFGVVGIDTDLKLLVISEGKSILSVPYSVFLGDTSDENVKIMLEACESVDQFLTEEFLTLARKFITMLKWIPNYSIPPELTQKIQEDFVGWRKVNDESGKPLFTADDLSTYMTVARYLTISRGDQTLTLQHWQDACELEQKRRQRLMDSRK